MNEPRRGAPGPRSPLALVLEFSRIEEPQDPYSFRFERQGYTLRTAAGGRERFEIDWSGHLLADLDALRDAGRDPACVQRVGEVLGRALRAAGWDALGRQIHAACEDQTPVIVTLRSNAAELYALPWELLTVGPSGQHLGELPGVLLRQEWPGTATTAEDPCPRPEGGRILLAWSAAGGAVPAAEHLRALATACSKGHVHFDPARDVLANATASGLADALAAAAASGQPFAALHLLCHGGRAGSTFGLVLGDDAGAASLVDAGRLPQLVAPHARTLRVVVLAACDGGNSGDPGNCLGSAAQALHRAGVESVLASRYPLSVAGSVVLAEALYHSLLVDLRSLEQAFIEARARLARDPRHLDWASVQLYAREADGHDTRPIVYRPYRGLLSFEAEHRRFFFGRDAERRETFADLQALIDAGEPRFIVVAGASGTGKSSLVLSGVVPDVEQWKARRPGPWEVATLRPGDRPQAALAAALAARADEGRPLLLVVDQFEELFTHCEDRAAREAFAQALWALAGADTGVHCILTIRVDFLARCGELVLDESGLRLDRVAYDEAHRVFVARMGPEQVRAAIEGPAARVGLTLAPGLSDRLLADIGGEPGALPLLQYALDRLWLRRVGRCLSVEVYGELGGLVGALQTRADGLIDDLAEGPRRHARRLLTRLVGIGDDEGVDTRRRVALAQLQPADEDARAAFDDLLGRLVDARLVVRSEEHGAPTLEIAHEALIRRWSRLRGWLAEDRGRLAELENFKEWLAQWDRHGTLLSGAQLGYATEILRRCSDDADARIRELVRVSAARERFVRRLSLAINSLLASLVFALTGLSLYARQQTSLANDRLIAAKQVTSEILTEVLPRYESIPGTADARREIHARLEALQRGLRTGAEDDAELLHMEILENFKRGELSWSHERYQQARAEFEQALQLAERLVEEHPERSEARHDLALTLCELGRLEHLAGDPAGGRAHLQRSLQVAEALAEAEPTDLKARRLLSRVLGSLGRMEMDANDLAAARVQLERSLKLHEELAASEPSRSALDQDLSFVLRGLGTVEMYAGDLDAARVHFTRAHKIDDARAKADPTSVDVQRNLTDSLRRLGEVEKRTGDLPAARAYFVRYLEIAEALAKADPTSVTERRYLCDALDLVAEVESDPPAVVAYLRRAREIRGTLLAADPANLLLQQDLFFSEHGLGVLFEEQGDLAAARVHIERALEIAEALEKSDPAKFRRLLAGALSARGSVEKGMGEWASARVHLERAVQVAELLAREDADNAEAQVEVAYGLRTLGELEMAASDPAAARRHVDRARAIVEALARQSPQDAAVQRELYYSLSTLSDLDIQAGDLRGARSGRGRALAVIEALVGGDPSHVADRQNLQFELERMGDLEIELGATAAGRARHLRRLELAEALAAADPSDTDAQRNLARALDKLGRVDMQTGDLAAARTHGDRSRRIFEKLASDAPQDGQAAFDLVEVHLHLVDLARREEQANAVKEHLAAARTLLDEMAARGQIAGLAEREQALALVSRELGGSKQRSSPR